MEYIAASRLLPQEHLKHKEANVQKRYDTGNNIYSNVHFSPCKNKNLRPPEERRDDVSGAVRAMCGVVEGQLSYITPQKNKSRD